MGVRLLGRWAGEMNGSVRQVPEDPEEKWEVQGGREVKSHETSIH